MATRGSNLDGVRRANLSTVLTRVHHAGALSRAQLTAETGLNRSTIAALVAALAALELVVEGDAPATNRVGRPSPLISVHPAPAVLAVNPEVDAVTIGVVGLGARVEHRTRHPVDHVITPAEAAGIVARMVDDLPRSAVRDRRLHGVGIAVPGVVERDGRVRWAPHLDWRDAAVAELIGDALALPAVAGNDASLGAVAEHLFGVGRGVDDLVYLNGGASGIGGGVIADGRLLSGRNGFAGEFGHNRPGVGAAADRRTADGALEDEVSRARLLDAVGLTEADEPALAEALRAAGDPAVRDELARQRRILATALSNAVNVLDPEMIVLGGFLATVLASGSDELERLVAAQSLPVDRPPIPLRPTALGGDLLMIGAAEAAFSSLLADPASARPATRPA